MMTIGKITLTEANAFVIEHHRHNGPVIGHKWSIGAYKDGRLVGVAIVGNPYSVKQNGKGILCVYRLCTDGTKNACSFLYAACARRAKCDGYKKIITYTLQSEPGTSLRAAGWTLESAKCGYLKWTGKRQKERESRPKQLSLFPEKRPPSEYKKRWAKVLHES
jgi:hypothetical protein